MNKSKYGVHKTHCCIFHGCKYGDPDCPVANGEIVQDYPCENCEDKYYIEIKSDTNDADYVIEISLISIDELLKILSLINDIKSCTEYHNYPCHEYVDENAQDMYPQYSDIIHETFRELCPSGERGFHTIESIYVYPYIEKEKLL